ncbi:hypothetical protein HPP92_028063 [Vanilla planifolia]|uniref:Uncharacterized protein n=1 Tax=Vanilla planifolia TaxID=51239 RepID=A0A835P6M5_VANPL|nr:hypothetical protein HPP92_028063 [Vanilla planifolia]KAG0448039.1 hypothetical protein HPP92_028034 [Vanilla planifolia]
MALDGEGLGFAGDDAPRAVFPSIVITKAHWCHGGYGPKRMLMLVMRLNPKRGIVLILRWSQPYSSYIMVDMRPHAILRLDLAAATFNGFTHEDPNRGVTPLTQEQPSIERRAWASRWSSHWALRERFRCGGAFPAVPDCMEAAGIHETTYNSIMKVMDIRKDSAEILCSVVIYNVSGHC